MPKLNRPLASGRAIGTPDNFNLVRNAAYSFLHTLPANSPVSKPLSGLPSMPDNH